jgi:arabinofuranan 3-O-arabinosyltransferase
VRPCRSEPILLPAGQQELVVSPGPALIVDGVTLDTPRAGEIPTATLTVVDPTQWSNDHRSVDIAASDGQRVLVVPESINPGWTAHDRDGTTLNPVTVNGWQQGWVLPAGTAGPVTLEFGANSPYRAGLIGGLALLPLLMLLAFVPGRTRRPPTEPAMTWSPHPVALAGAITLGAALIAGPVGAALAVLACIARHLLRHRESLWERLTVVTAAGGLVLAGAVLSRYPWRSVDGYVGHAPAVQFLALLSVIAVAVSAVQRATAGSVVSSTELSSGVGSVRRSQRRNALRQGDSTSA